MRVRLYEREEIAAGASGRNSGLIQHPMDEALAGVFAVSEALYAELGHGFELPARARRHPRRLRGPGALEPTARRPRGALPRAARRGARRRRRCATPSPRSPTASPPSGSTPAARPARRRHRRPSPPAPAPPAPSCIEGVAATPLVEDGRATGVRTAAGTEPPARSSSPPARGAPRSSTPPAPGGRSGPAGGVNVELRLAKPPRHALEEAGIQDLLHADSAADPLFSLVTARRPLRRSARRSCPSSPSRPRSRPRCVRARHALRARAGRHPRRLVPRLRAADERRRPPAARAAARRSGACSWPRATGRGGSRSGRARPGWSPTRSSGGPS